MVDLRAAVLDTNALIYYATSSRRLGDRAKRLLEAAKERQALVYIPLAVIWEMVMIDRAGRVRLRQTVSEFLDDLFSNPSFQPYDLTVDQIYNAGTLRFNRDPFDALIVAAAQSLELPLVTSDSEIHGSGSVRVLW